MSEEDCYRCYTCQVCNTCQYPCERDASDPACIEGFIRNQKWMFTKRLIKYAVLFEWVRFK